MGRVFFGAAALAFFFAAVGREPIPHPMAWGLVLMAIGLMLEGVPMIPWKRPGT